MTLSVVERGWDTGGQEVQKGEEEHAREWRKGDEAERKRQLVRPSTAVSPYHLPSIVCKKNFQTES